MAEPTVAQELALLLRGHSLNSATDLVQRSRVSQAAFDRFLITWHWSAPRFSSSHQDRLFRARGLDALDARIERCRRRVRAFLAACDGDSPEGGAPPPEAVG